MSTTSADDPGPVGPIGGLISRVAEGDEEAFSALYDQTSGRVHALARIMARDESAAGRLTRETYLQVWRRAHTYDPAAVSPLAWLLSLARQTGREARPAA